jgi:hypothetical protein
MGMRWQGRIGTVVTALGSVTAALIVSGSIPQAQGVRPITPDNFQYAAPRGFGDRNNSWAQSMVWWNNALYVGTSRQALCTSLFSLWRFAAGTVSLEFANTYLPYPGTDPDLPCAPDGADLSIQAEIWRWTPAGEQWQRVYQSPLEIDNPGPPPQPGKKLPYEMTFRGMAVHTDPGGEQAMYAFGVNTGVMWDTTKIPPPRILRTTDGVTYTPLPQAPGTFLGDLPFSADHTSFRSPVSYAGKLFVLSGPIFGQGTLIGSADPAKGNDAWFLGSPPGLLFYEMAVFNGWLYLGTYDPAGGYAVVKTKAQGTPPYQFVTVVPAGAYLTTRPSGSVVSMHVFKGRLYVGTATFTEVIRINPDDTWDLVVGAPRTAPALDGGVEGKYPLSGLDAGFGMTLNDHAWQMDDPYGYLYIGTYNAATGSKNDPIAGPLLQHTMGAHLYRTFDGWYYNAITTNGFANLGDPFGGKFDYGIRTMAPTPYGIFMGTSNDHYGLTILRATTHGAYAPDPPDRVEVEPTRTGTALLSWQANPRATVYQVWRAERNPILVRADLNFENWNGVTGNYVPDIYIGPYQLIGTTGATVFVDATVQPGKPYMYYVIAQDAQNRVSPQSNLVGFPLLTPPMTFAQMYREINRWERRARYADPTIRLTTLLEQVADAHALAAACQVEQAIQALNPQITSGALQTPESADLEILLSKLIRRLRNYQDLPQYVANGEVCAFEIRDSMKRR